MNSTNQTSVSWPELVGQKVRLKQPLVAPLDWTVTEPVTIGIDAVGTVKRKPIRGAKNGMSDQLEFGVEFSGYSGLFFPPLNWLICVDSFGNPQDNRQN